MKRILLLFAFLIFGFCSQPVLAQYTESINTNRPGISQGAFAVGRGVVQLEAGPYLGKDKHDLTGLENKTFGSEYQLRYGLLWENLEINVRGDFRFSDRSFPVGNQTESVSVSNFVFNTFGAKVLVYDPYKRHYFDKPNLYSWKANQRFKWWKLLPAVSIYAGYNFVPDNRPAGFPYFGGEIANSSAQVALITQHNWGGTALIMNFVADRINDDHKSYSAIFTLTQAVGMRSTIFADFQTIKDDFYSDELLRVGGAYLIMPDWQVDISAMFNFKKTPSRWQAGIGMSYRLDFHTKDERLKDPNERGGDLEERFPVH